MDEADRIIARYYDVEEVGDALFDAASDEYDEALALLDELTQRFMHLGALLERLRPIDADEES